MRPAAQRTLTQILRSRGIGAGVGTMIGLGWIVYGLWRLPNIDCVLLGSAGSAVAIWLLVRSRRLVIAARSLPSPNADARSADRRIWRLFWINFVVEIVLLNVAVSLLAQPAQHIYWIPAVSLVVGLHFLPMAVFFGVPSYWGTGLGMIAAATVVILALRQGIDDPRLLTAGEAFFNAVILWATAAWAVYTTSQLIGNDP